MSHHASLRSTSRLVVMVAASVAAVLVLAACSASPSSTATGDVVDDAPGVSEAMLKDHGLDGLDARQIIDRLDALPMDQRPDDLMASIRPNALIVADAAQREVTLPMPDDEFYVSIAPYGSATHECYFHSLTTCTGEIQNGDLRVVVTDADSGETLIDDMRTTFDNGFVGVWLPRDVDVNVTIEHEGRSATAALTTRGDDAATCVTTMQLA